MKTDLNISIQEVKSSIDEIIEDRYNGYRGTAYKDIQRLHNVIRNTKGEVFFLELLNELQMNNLKPVYEIKKRRPEGEYKTTTMTDENIILKPKL